MFSKMRKRFSYGNVALTLMLVFVMSGGAYAASKFVITSTKQIKPSVLKQLKGNNGAPGPAGATGPAGPQGAPGAKGENGASGGNGTNGTSAEATAFSGAKAPCSAGGVEIKSATPTVNLCNGKEGKEGKEGSPWTAGGVLPSGKTETGMWTTIFTATAAEQPMASAISFNIPLGSAPNEAHYILDGEPLPTGCSGTSAKPEAAPGNLCVFASTQRFVNESVVPTADGGAVIALSTAAAEAIAFGSWAVTAP